ncbi:MAG TPA: FCD domain-containing protein, partial [Moraxellaceae bacterium]|nr:FCD domain-containing protein [Moraxellaceae bacterium]
FSVTEGRPQKAFGEHHRIIEAIEARDGEMAEILMRRHIGSARKNIEAHFREHIAPSPESSAHEVSDARGKGRGDRPATNEE